ncbi:FkbM family methyltransferase [Metabacillus sp. Hm71]|uniref:FkbM family methyltransferase n=1 Tax=Metabacillus sp. Hm71 TaxID=3450743 RepID=UPI003F42F182
MQYYSQYGQDKYVNEKIFQNIENGFFVDIGAHDGIGFSNSYFFEKHKNWNGICIEPLPNVFKLLKKNRKCICVEGAIFTEEGYQDFRMLTGDLEFEMHSGIVNEYDDRHIERIEKLLKRTGGNSKLIKVKTFTLQSILENHNITHIDLLSIDTEGSELAVLQSIDFKKVKIECILVENNYQDEDVEDYLTKEGFRLVEKLDIDDIYIHTKSKFSV